MGRTQSLFVCLLLPLFLLIPVSALWSQLAGGRSIAGSIRVGEGRLPDERARVRLFNSSGALREELYAGTSGSFVFANLASGDYSVEVALAGFETTRQSVTILPIARYRATMLIVLQPEARRGAVPPQGIVDVRIPAAVREEWDKAQAELQAGHPDKARGHAEKAVKRDERFAAGYRLLAQLALDEGRLDECDSQLKRARPLEPDNTQQLVLEGALLNRRNRSTDALPLLQKAVAADPQSWRAQFELAQAYFATKQYPQALPYARKALEARGDPFPEAHVLLANVLMNLRQYPEAAQHLSTFLKMAPNSPSAAPARETLEKMKAAGISVP